MSTRKYRPYLSLPELKYLASLSHAHSPVSPLTRYLNRYVLDVESGYRKENHVQKPSMSEGLGFESRRSRGEQTKWEREQESRYLSDLMSPDEEKEYEQAQGLTGITATNSNPGMDY